MTIRTIKFFGFTDNNTVNVNFVFNGQEVFNGPVANGGVEGELFTFELSSEITGSIPATVTVNGGPLTVVALQSNYCKRPRLEATVDGITKPAVSEDDVINTFAYLSRGTNTSKTNIVIDGVAFDKGDVSEDAGAWHIPLTDGQTMTCDFEVDVIATEMV
jgi:archaellum component FlaF (FlaF/FlaG flagellin family)